MSPQRIQLSRRKGWRKPENTVVVARPSKWGNPFRIIAHAELPGHFQILDPQGMVFGHYALHADAAKDTVDCFREGVAPGLSWADLAGKNVGCWCPLDEPCHADVLLELANPRPLAEPIPFKGTLGMRALPADIEAQIASQS